MTEIWEDDKKWLAKIVEADKKKIGVKGKGKFNGEKFYKEFNYDGTVEGLRSKLIDENKYEV